MNPNLKGIIALAVQQLVNERLEEQLDVMPDVDTLSEIHAIEVSDTSKLVSTIRVAEKSGAPRYFSVKVSEIL